MSGVGRAVTAKRMDVENVGRMIKRSKRLVSWRLGVKDFDLVLCLRHSVTSGKKVLELDGHQVHAVPGGNPLDAYAFEFSAAEGVVLEVRATPFPGARGATPEFNYALRINGTPYEHLRRSSVYEVGSPAPPAPARPMSADLSASAAPAEAAAAAAAAAAVRPVSLRLPRPRASSSAPRRRPSDPQLLQSTGPQLLQSSGPQLLQSPDPQPLQSLAPQPLQSTGPQLLQSTELPPPAPPAAFDPFDTTPIAAPAPWPPQPQ